MEIILVDKDVALDPLNSWLAVAKTLEELPERMFMAVEGDRVIAVAGLRDCEGPACYLDSLATNPAMPSSARSEAIYLLVHAIEGSARSLGFKMLRAQSSVTSIVTRALDLGFELQPEIPFFRRL